MTATLKEALRDVVHAIAVVAVETNPRHALSIEEAEMHFHTALAEEPLTRPNGMSEDEFRGIKEQGS